MRATLVPARSVNCVLISFLSHAAPTHTVLSAEGEQEQTKHVFSFPCIVRVALVHVPCPEQELVELVQLVREVKHVEVEKKGS